MKTQPDYDAVFQALADIRQNLNEKLNLLDEQIRRAQLECQENAFQQKKEALAECQDGIDQQLIKLAVYVEEYRRLHGSLRSLNASIPQSGGTPQVMPEPLAGDTLLEILAARLDYLKSQGQITDR